MPAWHSAKRNANKRATQSVYCDTEVKSRLSTPDCKRKWFVVSPATPCQGHRRPKSAHQPKSAACTLAPKAIQETRFAFFALKRDDLCVSRPIALRRWRDLLASTARRRLFSEPDEPFARCPGLSSRRTENHPVRGRGGGLGNSGFIGGGGAVADWMFQ